MPVEPTGSERHRLKKTADGQKPPYQTRQRAAIVLPASRGRSSARIATETRLRVDTVRRRRGRFAGGRVPAPADRRRSGRPPTFTALQIAEVKALACRLPAESGTPPSMEIFFSIVQRKVVSPDDFTDLDEVRDRLRAFEDRCNVMAQPFQWRFTTTDLDDRLARLDRHALTDRREGSSTALAA